MNTLNIELLAVCLRTVIFERFKNNMNFVVGPFELGYTETAGQDNEWGASIVSGVPETCAAIRYCGGGHTIDEALEQLKIAVLSDRPMPSEIG